MRTLILTSHRLGDYQRCPRLYKWTSVDHLRPSPLPAGILKGSATTKFLEAYYKAKMAGDLTRDAIIKWGEEFTTEYVTDFRMRELTRSRLYHYTAYYKHESWVPIAVEAGFSRVLFQEGNDLIIYEGCPDLVVWIDSSKRQRAIVDHKSRAFEYKLYHYANQNLGYSWATGIKTFAYNLIGLQKTGTPGEWFQREVVTFSRADISAWEEATIEWGRRILKDEVLPPSYACVDKFGFCWYNKLCLLNGVQPLTQIMMQHSFKTEEHESWPSVEIGEGGKE